MRVIQSPTFRRSHSGGSMIPCFRRIASTIAAALLLPACVCWSQTNFGRISGTVQDASGARIPGAVVTVTNPATGFRQNLKTDASGLFVYPSLPAGTYDLRVEREGFKASEERGLVLDAASSRDVTIVLDVG